MPSQPLIADVAARESLHVSRCVLRFDGAWHLDERSLRNAVTRRTRAVLVGNPSEPRGAILDREELEFVEEICARHGLALISDETYAGTIGSSWVSALEATRCLVVQISGLSGLCGLAAFGEWCVVAGPEELAVPALALLDDQLADNQQAGSISTAGLLSVPALLARRERFLSRVRERLVANRASLAARAVGESPWSLLWGRGGRWAVLEVGAAEDEETPCQELLDDGVAVQPGSWFGLPQSGYIVLSLLPSEDVFPEALTRLDHRLRGPLRG